MPVWPFSPGKDLSEADALLGRVTAVSRNAAFFGEGRAPDTLEGRFEVVTLHAALALIRLRAAPEAKDVGQRFTDKLFRQFDSGLREAGTGDLSVPKRMHKLAGAFYGRLDVYAGAIAAGEQAGLEQALVRNVFGGRESVFVSALAGYAQATAAHQAARPAADLAQADGWLAPPG